MFKKIDRVFIDGIFLVWTLRLLGVPVERRSFDMTSMAAEVFGRASRSGETVYLVGGEAGVAQQAAESFTRLWPALKVVGTRSGFFASPGERQEFIESLVKMGPDIVIAGMGTPKQEYILSDLVANGWRGDGYTCGGFLHQTAKRGVRYYPRLIDKLNLRWAFRVFDEPRLLRRYTHDVLRFVWLFTFDYIKYRLKGAR